MITGTLICNFVYYINFKLISFLDYSTPENGNGKINKLDTYISTRQTKYYDNFLPGNHV